VWNSRIRGPDYHPGFDDPEQSDDVNERERTENRDNNAPPKLGLNFTEAAGKTVAFVNVINDSPSWQALEIRFTEGTLLCFELKTSRTQMSVGGLFCAVCRMCGGNELDHALDRAAEQTRRHIEQVLADGDAESTAALDDREDGGHIWASFLAVIDHQNVFFLKSLRYRTP
jgi:hypothetical protein